MYSMDYDDKRFTLYTIYEELHQKSCISHGKKDFMNKEEFARKVFFDMLD